MGKQFGYKKYMKKEAQQDNSLVKIFVISFFGMLLVFTFLIKSFSPSVDTSIGEYHQPAEPENVEEIKKIVDNRLEIIQNEDQGQNFSDLMSKTEDVVKEPVKPVAEPENKKLLFKNLFLLRYQHLKLSLFIKFL